MNPITHLGDAAIGWLDLVGGRSPGTRFRANRSGLIVAIGYYVVAVLLVLFVQAQTQFSTLPTIDQAVISLLFNAIPLLVVYLIAFITVRLLKPAAGLLDILVPATYGLTLIIAVGLPLSLFSGNQVSAALHGLYGYMLYRLARETGKFNIGSSIAYAGLSVLLLVAVPVALYMLMIPEIPTPG